MAGLPGSLVPYSLRHSCIMGGLFAGLPVRLVAAAHDTSTAMIEKHHHGRIVDAVGDLLRRRWGRTAQAGLAAACARKLVH